MFCCIASDLDGTLLNDDKKISSTNKQTLQSLTDKHLVFASGRAIENMFFIGDELGGSREYYMIGYNGAKCIRYSDKQTLFHINLEPQVSKQLLAFMKKHSIFFTIYTSQGVFAAPINEEEHKQRTLILQSFTGVLIELVEDLDSFLDCEIILGQVICNTEEEADQYVALLKQHFASHMVSIIKSHCSNSTHKQFYVEVLNPVVNKGFALKKLCSEVLMINHQEVIAFGDGENDLEMLEHAGHSICVKNACEKAKLVAKKVSDLTNHEDAVAHELVKICQL